MAADVVDAGISEAVRQHDHAGALLRIEADEGAIAAGAAVVPDDLLTGGRFEDVPSESNLQCGTAGGRRVASWALIAGASGDFVKPSSAKRNSSRSFALDRSAPAPASVGRSQFLAIGRR